MPSRGRVAALFAGIGGLEVGFERAGFETALVCDNSDAALAVMRDRFPLYTSDTKIKWVDDIHATDTMAGFDVVTAGFPCQDLSQAGRTAGIKGEKSGLVTAMFERLPRSGLRPSTIVIENVPFMLKLDGGEAMTFLTRELEKRGYRWAYRTVDSMAFGLPHRRRRVYVVATTDDGPDPRSVLFADEAGKPDLGKQLGEAFGFYWTEGNTGVGWAADAIPPLKGGSGLGIASPPAVWIPDEGVFTPTIEAAERLHGFDPGWTKAADRLGERNPRWRLIGNAVSPPVAEWVARRLVEPGEIPIDLQRPFRPDRSWPGAAYGWDGHRSEVELSAWPEAVRRVRLLSIMGIGDRVPLSERAAGGFLKRISATNLAPHPGFLEGLRDHLVMLGADPDLYDTRT